MEPITVISVSYLNTNAHAQPLCVLARRELKAACVMCSLIITKPPSSYRRTSVNGEKKSLWNITAFINISHILHFLQSAVILFQYIFEVSL